MYMRAFAQAWPDAEFVQQAVGQLPWGHNLVLLSKLKTELERRWYAAKAIEHNWSRNVLVMQIETRLRERSGSAVTNFEVTSLSTTQLVLDWRDTSGETGYRIERLGS